MDQQLGVPIGVGTPRRLTGSTTGRTAANPSVRLFGGYAAGEKIDDLRLRLPVAVEPVIGDHSSREDDADPECERKRARNPGCPGRYPVGIPAGDPGKNARVKDQYVQAG